MPRGYDSTAIGGAEGQFPRTEWTRILDVRQRQAIISELCHKYWKPLYRYLRCRGYSSDTAQDLVQGFFTEKILSQELVRRADRARGRFRTLLLVAVKNYAINAQKAGKARAARGPENQAVGHERGPEVEFNRTWAQGVLREVLRDLKAECEFKQKVKHWQVFSAWLLEPEVDDSPRRMDDICVRYGVAAPAVAYNMISNLKGRFRAILRDHLRPMVESESQLDDEIRSLIASFSE